MGGGSVVEGNGYRFDLAGLLSALEAHLPMVLLLLFVGFMFWVFQKGGFAERFLDARQRKRELDARQLENLRHIADKLGRKYDGDEPFLPLPDFAGKEDKPR